MACGFFAAAAESEDGECGEQQYSPNFTIVLLSGLGWANGALKDVFCRK